MPEDIGMLGYIGKEVKWWPACGVGVLHSWAGLVDWLWRGPVVWGEVWMIKQYGYFSRSTGGQVESHVLFYWCCQENKLQNTNKLNKI